ncbi:MAG: cytochrome c, partial [Planctomycetota bacterium]
LEALVDYTIYLSVRGEAERELLAMAVDELGYDSEAPEGGLGFSEALTSDGQLTDSESAGVVREVLGEIAQEWGNASSQEAPVLPVPAGVVALSGRTAKTMTWNEDAVRRGEAIFHGPIANCVGCHGKAGRADVVTLDYDDWTKEYTTRIGITPTDKDAIRPLRKLGAMPPRQIRPRRLADQVYHGDETPESVYRRITQGIAGTPMPAVLITEEPSPTGLTGEQVWDLVSYVMSLGRNANTTETALR